MPAAEHRHVLGVDALTGALRALPEDMRTRTLAAGMKALLQPIKIAAKRFAKRSEDTGALRESITEKVVSYPEQARVVGLVGPDRHYYSHGIRIKTGFGRLLAKNKRRPANYAHLVEYGHVSVKPRKGTSRRKKNAIVTKKEFVPAKPFLRPAVLTTQSQQADAFAEGIARGLKSAIDREVKSGRHVQAA
jgi:hypothetical protein